MPPNAAELDALLAQKDYLKLGTILKSAKTADEVLQYMNWQQRKLLSGASAFINFAYIFDLDRVGHSLTDHRALELKKTSAVIWLYAFTLILVDGVKCKDVSAPENRKNQLLTVFPRVVQFMRAIPATELEGLVNIAIKMEVNTASMRVDDDFLCRDGLAAMQAGIAKFGDKATREVPTPPGGVGTTKEIMADPDYKPEFLPKDVWEPKQKEMRAGMLAILAKLTSRPANNK